VNNLKYDIGVAKSCITAFRPQVQKSGELQHACIEHIPNPLKA
jgi:hypothetical protein